MREILFRGKKFTDGKWAESRCPDGVPIILISGTIRDDFDPATVGQYTGLKDKHGVKIFEGDVIKWDPREWGSPFSEIVTWDYELFTMRRHDWPEWCEVVGNIYDNPELMEECAP